MNILFINSLPKAFIEKSPNVASWITQMLWCKKLSSQGRLIKFSVKRYPFAILLLPFVILLRKVDRIVVYNLMKRAPLNLINSVASFFKIPVTAIVSDVSDSWQVKMAKELRFVQRRIVITDAIANDFAPGLPYEVEDGSGLREQFLFNKSTPHDLSNLRLNNKFTIVYAGALQPYNCINTMLDYMQICNDSDTELILVGNAPNVDLLGKVKSAITRDNRIKYVGLVSQSELKTIYAKASVLLCLRDESYPLMRYHFPSKIFELIETGKPVIASDTGHLKEKYGQFIHVIDKPDAQSLVDAIRTIKCNAKNN